MNETKDVTDREAVPEGPPEVPPPPPPPADGPGLLESVDIGMLVTTVGPDGPRLVRLEIEMGVVEVNGGVVGVGVGEVSGGGAETDGGGGGGRFVIICVVVVPPP